MHETIADYEDGKALANFAKQCDVITYEFENVPAKTAALLADLCLLAPGAKALEIAQDRLHEKTFIVQEANVPVAPFRPIEHMEALTQAIEALGLPCVLKTRRMGYDGKGHVIIRRLEDAAAAFEQLGGRELILEGFIPFAREISIVAARTRTGDFKAYPPIENVHKNHILHTSLCSAQPCSAQSCAHTPSAPTNGTYLSASELAQRIMSALDYVGIMATEFFELADGSLMVNEIAPRVHNSGHFSQNAGCVDQFEQHIRAICGWSLADMIPTHSVEMTNLIGHDMDDLTGWAARPDCHIHLYGKSETRAGRKMGHVNRIMKPA